MVDRLATIDMGRKVGAAVPLSGGGAGSPFDTMSLGTRPTFVPGNILIHQAVWPQQTWTENWGVPLFEGGAGPPSNTMWPESRPTSVPSGILIHLTVWP